jgi:hypothetical protein
MHARLWSALAAGAAAVAIAGMMPGSAFGSTGDATRATVSAPRAMSAAPAAAQLPDLVSGTAASWTPNVFPGSLACNPQWFGSNCKYSTIYSTAVVNGEVVVAGAFTQVCEPGPAADGHCAPGTTVTRNDIFAYQLGTGTIDPGFAPVLDQGPVYALAAGPGNTVYVGGAFTTVNGTAHAGVVQLSVTPGSSSDGQVVSGFTGQVTGAPNALAFGGNALYVGGQFSAADGVAVKALARLNATTGAYDKSFQLTLGNAITGTALAVNTMSLTPSGGLLAIGGSFLQVNGQSRPRVALIDTGGGLGKTASLANWAAPILANNCSSEHNYVNALDFSPDGSFFVVATTGFKSAGGASICDAAARFETGATGTSVSPVWINYTGGDTLSAVAVAGSVVYLGGHDRWNNNECGDNTVCEANAVLVDGVSAIDSNTGMTLPWWTPGTLRGVGVQSLTPIPPGAVPGFGGGLVLGTDVNIIGGTFHGDNALFPLTSTASQVPGGPIRSGIFSLGRLGGLDESTQGVAAMCMDDASDSSANGNKIQLYTCLGGAAQNWTIEPDGSIQVNTNECLQVAGNYTNPPNGAKINLWACNGAASQQWHAGPGNTLVGQGGKCLDDPAASTKNSTQLQLWTCDGNIQQVWPLPAAQAPPPPPPTGTVSSQLVGKHDVVPCLDDPRDAATSGTPVQISVCIESDEQTWTVESDSTIQIHGLCLDTAAGGTASGTLVALDTCNGSATQTWQYSYTTHALTNKGANQCLTIPGSVTTNGTQLQITSCNGARNQAWWLPAV